MIACGESESTFKNDMRKEKGWTLLKDSSRELISVKDLQLLPFLENGMIALYGVELVERARYLKASYGQHDAEWLLEHQDEIPKEFRGYNLVFPETMWENQSGNRQVATLEFLGERWVIYFRWFDFVFSSNDRLIRPRK